MRLNPDFELEPLGVALGLEFGEKPLGLAQAFEGDFFVSKGGAMAGSLFRDEGTQGNSPGFFDPAVAFLKPGFDFALMLLCIDHPQRMDASEL